VIFMASPRGDWEGICHSVPDVAVKGNSGGSAGLSVDGLIG
jgi:hypothetical protein